MYKRQDLDWPEMTWNFACSTTETSTWADGGRKFGELMEKATGGKVKVNIYAADQLTNGNQSEGIQALMNGDPVQISMHSNPVSYTHLDNFKDPEERKLMEKSATCIHKNLLYIKEHYPQTTEEFLDKAEKLKTALTEASEDFLIQMCIRDRYSLIRIRRSSGG